MTNTNHQKEKKRIRPILLAIVTASSVLLIFSIYKVASIADQYLSARKQYAEINTLYAASAPDYIYFPPPDDLTNAEDSKVNSSVETSPVEIDFNSLTEEYPDIAGWIYSEGTIISYPIVQAKDNDYYLHRYIDASYSYGGTLFIDIVCRKDFSTANTIIYGHNMNDGSMFGSLTEYRSQKYYDSHPFMYLNTPHGDYKLEIFAAYTTPAESFAYTYEFADSKTYGDYLEKACSESDIKCLYLPNTDDYIVTLSTCAYDYEDARYVVQARLVSIN